MVVLGQHDEKKGAGARAAAVFVAQVRLTLMALGLALMMAPIAAAFEQLPVNGEARGKSLRELISAGLARESMLVGSEHATCDSARRRHAVGPTIGEKLAL